MVLPGMPLLSQTSAEVRPVGASSPDTLEKLALPFRDLTSLFGSIVRGVGHRRSNFAALFLGRRCDVVDRMGQRGRQHQSHGPPKQASGDLDDRDAHWKQNYCHTKQYADKPEH
jgi:hypothetical protein